MQVAEGHELLGSELLESMSVEVAPSLQGLHGRLRGVDPGE
jgi:hypothetical protein